MKPINTLLLCLILLASPAAADTLLEVYADSTFAGLPGYLLKVSEFGDRVETVFATVDAGQARIHAVRNDEFGTWDFLPPDSFFGPPPGAVAGDSWSTSPDDLGRLSHSTLDLLESFTVPAGTFSTARCLVQPDVPTNYFPVSEIRHFAGGVGLVRQFWPWDQSADVLSSYFVGGGSGYLPLAVGNWWYYVVDEVSPVSRMPVARNLLHGNYPNPFNPTTRIVFELAQADLVQLTVHDASGRLVRRLVSGERAAGQQVVTWDGRDDNGRSVAAGVYVYRLMAGRSVQSRTMTLVK